MKKNASPILIAVGIIALLGFCYYMYRSSTPELTGPYDARNGPPAYARPGGGGGGAPQKPGQAPK